VHIAQKGATSLVNRNHVRNKPMPPKTAAAPVQKSASRFGRVKSNLKMGIVGLPNVGKSSLFNLMCDMQVGARVKISFGRGAHWELLYCRHLPRTSLFVPSSPTTHRLQFQMKGRKRRLQAPKLCYSSDMPAKVRLAVRPVAATIAIPGIVARC
jgi:hypothetical protein